MPIDLVFSREAQARGPSPLKSLLPHMGPGVISLGGGLPHPSIFPFLDMSVHVQSPASAVDTSPLTIQVTSAPTGGPGSPALASLLQYGGGVGYPGFLSWVKGEMERIRATPRYEGWDVVQTAGNTDGIDKTLRVLCNPGDTVFVEEYCYPGFVESSRALGLQLHAVTMDEEGIVPHSLRKAVQAVRQARGPLEARVLYLVPTGQNPTGRSMGVERRREVMACAEDLELLIIEDDPYYHLQYPKETGNGTTEKLLPPLLSFDTQGRVIRLDTLSKVLSPGLRCGSLTAQASLCQRVVYNNEVSIQRPSGFSEAVVESLMRSWGPEGWDTHLRGVRETYRRRRDALLKACQRELTGLAEWSAPVAGMFIWMRLILPTQTLEKAGLMDQFFKDAIAAGVLIVPSWQFAVPDPTTGQINRDTPTLRTTFAYAGEEEMDQAIVRLAGVIRQYQAGA
ncbi:pyridoxal phosphate-dependent transferase [Piptocephalis cylindrospora]|uniref:Pyridoxal phosphate-dependent transferase n=1 Tax=Piptocephalis cylindrospora TaxID=1907219 RepID=A0A4V1IYD3_9FUNG|nr:pyridoxal phosphate-dependent transferase [Piptocephalis cylindrospora]|eukprot:RKP14159.1 pyridoxal phosphate-dependent transferase [Piptocephalis cylindrospora]